ncbi:MAG: calcium/sodium antiporter [Proteobacteria bacterium]|nr:calcium/sodium antiporter [Pseudomonadota bacterium]
MSMDILMVVAGLGLLFAGGEGLVRGAVSIAERLGLSTLLVSTVIVGFGTSIPELMVSLQAALDGSPDIALGNVVGSNTANILLILGLAALLMPVICKGAAVRRDAAAGVLAAVILCALSFTGRLEWPAGLLMAGGLGFYLWRICRAEREATSNTAVAEAELREHIMEDRAAHKPLVVSVACAAGGLVLLIFGARLLVKGAVSLALAAGVSEAVIGLTLVAVGTSLPEMAAAVVSALRRHADVVIGNILGSNLFNVMGILGVTALVAPISFAGRIADIDVWIMLAVQVSLLAVIFLRGRIGRTTGCVFLALYAGYSGWLFTAG